MRVKVFFRTALLLLALNFMAENLGYLTHQLYRFFGIMGLMCYGLSIYPFGKRTEKRGLLFGGVTLLALSVLFFQGPVLFRLAGTALFLYALQLILKSKDSHPRELPLLLFTVSIYFYFMLFYLFSPHVWYGMQATAFWFSGLFSGLAGEPAVFAATFLGLPVSVLFFIFILLSYFYTAKKRPVLHGLSIISLAALSGCYLILCGYLPALGKSLMNLFSDENNFLRLFLGFLFEKDYPLIRYNYMMNAPVLLFILYMLPLFIILRAGNLEKFSFQRTQGKFMRTFAFLLMTTLAAAILTVDLPGSFSEKRRVVLYNKGFLNWRVPDFRMYGSKSAGMFGNLPKLLDAMGFSSVMTDTITKEVLQQSRTLVMINTDKEIARDELEAVWNFVENGGSLLLLCDHTFYKHGVKRIILNDVLEPYRIRFNFDSADWFVGGWLHSYQYAAGHPVTAGMRDDMNDAGSVIGASLAVKPPAYPLVIGKYGYSDPGNESDEGRRGYLGNLNYDPGEPMGDVVLSAVQHYGKGKVMVFGDTSGFANAIMVNSYDFVNRVFTWLARDESPPRFGPAFVAAVILGLFAVFLYLQSSRNPLVIIISIMLALIVTWWAETINRNDARRPLQGKIAYVDASHGERFSPESWNKNAVLGLHLNLMRNGYLSFYMHTFEKEKLDQADLMVLIAPSQPFTKKEIGWIRDFVFGGGKLIMTVGWEERGASVPLMTSFGFAVDNLPLAQFISLISHADRKVKFFEAWPLISSDGQAEIIASYRMLPVAMKKAYGKGQVVMIGDSSFFWNQNLEMEESHINENVRFLQWLLNSIETGKGDKL